MMKWSSLDERQKNVVKSFWIAFVTLIILTVSLAYILEPLRQAQIDEMEEMCSGFETCEYTISTSPFLMLMALPALIVFSVSMKVLEKRRLRNWRSWK